MMRQVQGADGRTWTVRREINWATPAIGDEFEHDVAPGYQSAFVLGLIAVLLFAVLLAWTPPQVSTPSWLFLFLGIVVVWALARWALRRSWTLVAEVSDDDVYELPGQRWVGTVTGLRLAHLEAVRTAKQIQVRNGPDTEGPLELVE